MRAPLQITVFRCLHLIREQYYLSDQFTFDVLGKKYGIYAVRGPRGIPAKLGEALNEQMQEKKITQKARRILLRRALCFGFYPSIRICFFSGTFLTSFLGIVRLSTPFSYLALISSSVMLPPT